MFFKGKLKAYDFYDLTVDLPTNWLMEESEDKDHMIFYPDNSDLTVRVSSLIAETAEKIASASLLENAFIRSVKDLYSDATEIKVKSLKGYKALGYKTKYIEDSQNVYVINIANIKDGRMIKVDIYSTNEKETTFALEYFYNIKEKNK